ncbi:MAG TPA: glucokinase [Rhodocyclaceae bacterium]|nr:glucokinase [Rhodocyclaceae bacterium]
MTNEMSTYPRLVGDVGGTNARFALIEAPGGAPARIVTLHSGDYVGPVEAIRAYLSQGNLPAPHSAAIAIATPVKGDAISMTNHPWKFSIEATRQALGLERLLFVNDFTALALSLPHLTSAEFVKTGGGEAQAGYAIGVIGPGTGLGISGLVPCAGGYVPIEGEGGHATLSTQSVEEAAVLAALARQYDHVSAERALSGPGLLALYRALAIVRGVPAQDLDPKTISQHAMQNSDALCVDACNMFCALLGTAAANLALTLGARGGLFIGGGIVPQLGVHENEFFARSPFRARFETKGRFSDYLRQIPTLVITAAFPTLTGAAEALQRSQSRS